MRSTTTFGLSILILGSMNGVQGSTYPAVTNPPSVGGSFDGCLDGTRRLAPWRPEGPDGAGSTRSTAEGRDAQRDPRRPPDDLTPRSGHVSGALGKIRREIQDAQTVKRLDDRYDRAARIGIRIKDTEAEVSALEARQRALEKALGQPGNDDVATSMEISKTKAMIQKERSDLQRYYQMQRLATEAVTPSELLTLAQHQGTEGSDTDLSFVDRVRVAKAESLLQNRKRQKAEQELRDAERVLAEAIGVHGNDSEQAKRARKEVRIAAQKARDTLADYEKHQWRMQLLTSAQLLLTNAESGTVLLKEVGPEETKLIGSQFTNYGPHSYLTVPTQAFEGVRGFGGTTKGVGGYRSRVPLNGNEANEILNLSAAAPDTYKQVTATPDRNNAHTRLREASVTPMGQIQDILDGKVTEAELHVLAEGSISPVGRGQQVSWGRGDQNYNSSNAEMLPGGRSQYVRASPPRDPLTGKPVSTPQLQIDSMWVPVKVDGKWTYQKRTLPTAVNVRFAPPARNNRDDVIAFSVNPPLGDRHFVGTDTSVKVPAAIRRMTLDLVDELALYRKTVRDAAGPSYSIVNPDFSPTAKVNEEFDTIAQLHREAFQRGIQALRDIRNKVAATAPSKDTAKLRDGVETLERQIAVNIGARLMELAAVTPQGAQIIPGLTPELRTFIEQNRDAFEEGRKLYLDQLRNNIDSNGPIPVETFASQFQITGSGDNLEVVVTRPTPAPSTDPVFTPPNP